MKVVVRHCPDAHALQNTTDTQQCKIVARDEARPPQKPSLQPLTTAGAALHFTHSARWPPWVWLPVSADVPSVTAARPQLPGTLLTFGGGNWQEKGHRG